MGDSSVSIEEALIAQAMPHMLSEKAKALVKQESSKGCLPNVWSQPVSLEPPYSHFQSTRESQDENDAVIEIPSNEDELSRLQVWISPNQAFEWKRSELFLKQLQGVTHRVGLEIVGNEERITQSFLCHKTDVPILTAAFHGEFDQCMLTPLPDNVWKSITDDQWETAEFYDFYPLPPYSHLLTRPDELHNSPFEPLITAMAMIPNYALCIYQALFQPVSPCHNWHRNVQILHDLEYTINLLSSPQSPIRYAQQTPSGDLRQMAMEVETKAHNDKPFYALALRVAILGANGQDFLRSLSTFTNLFQHGGRPSSRSAGNTIPFLRGKSAPCSNWD